MFLFLEVNLLLDVVLDLEIEKFDVDLDLGIVEQDLRNVVDLNHLDVQNLHRNALKNAHILTNEILLRNLQNLQKVL